jgi:hypothetical protein
VTHGTRIARRELAAIAAALLLPIPLLAAGALRLPLPDAVERGVASLTSGGGLDAAVVEVATRPEVARAVPSSIEPARSPEPSSRRPARAAAAPSPAGATVARTERQAPSREDRDLPTSPGGGGGDAPGEDGDSVPGGNTGDEDTDVPEPPATQLTETAPVETEAVVDVQVPGTSVGVVVDDEGIDVSTDGGSASPVPDVPVPPPPLPLP